MGTGGTAGCWFDFAGLKAALSEAKEDLRVGCGGAKDVVATDELEEWPMVPVSLGLEPK